MIEGQGVSGFGDPQRDTGADGGEGARESARAPAPLGDEVETNEGNHVSDGGFP